jgi:hypothetical protein
MTINSEIIIEWSKVSTSRLNYYPPEISHLMAILLVTILRGESINPGRSSLVGEAAMISATVFRKLTDVDEEITNVLYSKNSSRPVFAPGLEVAELYKNKVFGFKGGIRRKLQRVFRDTPKNSALEQRIYIEKITAIWHEAVKFPPEIAQENNSGGIFLNLRDSETNGDLQAIKEYVTALKL